jgi:hypothetical protein
MSGAMHMPLGMQYYAWTCERSCSRGAEPRALCLVECRAQQTRRARCAIRKPTMYTCYGKRTVHKTGLQSTPDFRSHLKDISVAGVVSRRAVHLPVIDRAMPVSW